MLFGIIFLGLAKNNIKKYKKIKENYTSGQSFQGGSYFAINTFYTVLGIIMLMIELIFMFFNFSIAYKCTKPGAERIINIMLAMTIPIPYMFGNILFNNCAKVTLQSNKLF